MPSERARMIDFEAVKATHNRATGYFLVRGAPAVARVISAGLPDATFCAADAETPGAGSWAHTFLMGGVALRGRRPKPLRRKK